MNRIFTSALAGAVLAAILSAPGPASAQASDQSQLCVHAAGQTQIDACTWVIQSGQWSGANLAWAYENRGLAYYGMSQFANAILEFNQAIALKPDEVNAIGDRGAAYGTTGQYALEIQDLDTALGMRPDPIDFRNRGIAYEHLGQHARAVQDEDQAIAMKPDYASAFVSRSIAKASLGDAAGAAADLAQAKALDPSIK